MIMVQWSCEVPQENLKDFLKFVNEKLNAFYESFACKRYELFLPVETKKQYFSFQVKPKTNRYIEQLIFDNIEGFENFIEAVEKDPHHKEIVESYIEEFNVSSCNFTIYTQII